MSLSSQENTLFVNQGDRFFSQTTNIPPFANDDVVNTAPNTPVSINVLSNDLEPDNLDLNSIDLEPNQPDIQNIASVTEGIFNVDTAGQVIFTPNENFNIGSQAITDYVVSDFNDLISNPANIIVNAADDGTIPSQPAPILADDPIITTINQPVNFNIGANDIGEITAFDLDLGQPDIQVNNNNSDGSFSVDNQGNLVFTPVENFIGTAVLPYNVIDSIGQPAANPANISITVNDPAIPPTPTPTPIPTPTPTPPGGITDFAYPRVPVLVPLSILNIPIPDTGTINGDANSEVIYAEVANDTILGNGGNDTLVAYPKNTPDLIARNVLVGADGDDLLFGSLGNDTLIVEAGNNIILANNGDDFLQAGAGNDTLAGQAGNDWIVVADGNNLIYGQAGDDTIQGGNQNDSVSGDVGNDWIQTGLGNDWVFGDFGNDIIFGEDGNDTLLGDNNSGADTEGTTTDQDLLFAGVGNDLILGHQGNDTLLGGADNDTLWGGKENDLLFGDDDIEGIIGNDLLIGGVGNDTIVGNGGDDTIYGDNTDSSLTDINDLLIGGDGNDTIFGNNGSDSISGGNGDDSLLGGKGDDIIFGGVGNDTIATGEGSDQIYLTINQGVDLITDFQSGVDRLVLIDGVTINQLQLTPRDGDTVITYSDNQELAILQNVVISDLASLFNN